MSDSETTRSNKPGSSRSRLKLLKIKPPFVAVLLLLLIGVCTSGIAQTEKKRKQLPEGQNGIAANYPGDAGIHKDKRVVFVEQFEEQTVTKLASRWETARGKNTGQFLFSKQTPENSAGKKSLIMKHIGGKKATLDLYRRLKNENGNFGYEKLFVRVYVRFGKNCHPLHHGPLSMGGYRPAKPWPKGGAGTRPDGDKKFTVSFEPFGKSWTWDYYTYWMEMRGSPPNGKTWGNSFIHNDKLKVKKGKWYCIELMIKLNDPGKRNGELAAWINGKNVSHLGKGFPRGTWIWDKFKPGREGPGIKWENGRKKIPGNKPFKGFRWRTTKKLKINYVKPFVYITDAPEGHVSNVWFDHLVVAKSYIGPLQ